MKSKKLFTLVMSVALVVSILSAPMAFAKETTVVHKYNNFSITTGNSFSTTTTLSRKYKYGKAFYYNNSNTTVTMRISRTETITIPAWKSGSISWKKGLLTSTYEVEIRCPSAELNGTFSLAMSDAAFA